MRTRNSAAGIEIAKVRKKLIDKAHQEITQRATNGNAVRTISSKERFNEGVRYLFKACNQSFADRIVVVSSDVAGAICCGMSFICKETYLVKEARQSKTNLYVDSIQ